jgi:hypothetical protein
MSLFKNFELKNVVKALVITVFYDLVRCLLFIRSKLVHGVIGTIKAHAFVLRNLKAILVKRRVIQQHRVLSDDALVRMGLMATLRESLFEFKKVEL